MASSIGFASNEWELWRSATGVRRVWMVARYWRLHSYGFQPTIEFMSSVI